MSNTIWKPIPGFEGRYEISTFGKVKSLPKIVKRGYCFIETKERILINQINGGGYEQVGLSDGNSYRLFRINVLVAMAFLNHDTKSGLVVDHINKIRHDNRLENLQVITQRQNSSRNIKGHSRFIGVTLHKKSKRWYASIKKDGKSIHLGSFKCETSAHIQYLKTLKRLEK
jgi:hypothetical protein